MSATTASFSGSHKLAVAPAFDGGLLHGFVCSCSNVADHLFLCRLWCTDGELPSQLIVQVISCGPPLDSQPHRLNKFTSCRGSGGESRRVYRKAFQNCYHRRLRHLASSQSTRMIPSTSYSTAALDNTDSAFRTNEPSSRCAPSDRLPAVQSFRTDVMPSSRRL
jgi:hypothetical protein